MPKKLVKAHSTKIASKTDSKNPEEGSPQRQYKTRGVAEALKKTQAQLLREQMNRVMNKGKPGRGRPKKNTLILSS